MKKYKYIHLLLHDELVFSRRLVEMFSDSDNKFETDKQLVVTPIKNIYDDLGTFGVVYDPLSLHELVNKYSEECDYIFLHSINHIQEILKVKRKYLNKIVWRTWGHDAHLFIYNKKYVKNIAKFFANNLLKSRYNQFAAIGLANMVDILDIEEKFGIPRSRMFRLAYVSKKADSLNPENIILANTNKLRKDNTNVNVLIGHSGWDDQILVMDALYRFINEPIQLFSLLSYGPEDKIKEINDYGRSVWKEKFTPVFEYLPYRKYVEFIHDIDIGILPGERSYALGCLSQLLMQRKKIYLDKNGIIKRTFDIEKIPYGIFNDLDKMNFSEFVEPVVYDDNAGINMKPLGYKKGVMKWHEFYDYLDSKKLHNQIS